MAASKRSQRVIKDGQERISFNSEDSVCGSARIWVAMPRTWFAIKVADAQT